MFHGTSIAFHCAEVRMLGIIKEVEEENSNIIINIETRDRNKTSIPLIAVIPREKLNTRRNFASFINRAIVCNGHISMSDGEFVVIIEEYKVLSKANTEKVLNKELIIVSEGVI